MSAYFSFFFFFNDTATTEIYTLSLHHALPISSRQSVSKRMETPLLWAPKGDPRQPAPIRDRKSTRLNSSHGYISYAVFCLKKKIKIMVVIFRHIIDRTMPHRSST